MITPNGINYFKQLRSDIVKNLVYIILSPHDFESLFRVKIVVVFKLTRGDLTGVNLVQNIKKLKHFHVIEHYRRKINA
jgi:hypothetical protein